MGLDMYLYERKREHFWQPEKTALALAFARDVMDIDIDRQAGNPSHVTMDFEVGYWRKANAVHGWFVSNIQGGVDNCEEHPVSLEQLTELRRVCQQVLENHELAPDLLPPTQGFFFGGNEMGEYYFEQLKQTVEIINRLEVDYVQDRLSESAWDRDFFYVASW